MTDKHTCDGLGSGRVGAGCGTMAVCVAPEGYSGVRCTNGPYATVSGPEGSPWKGAAPAGGGGCGGLRNAIPAQRPMECQVVGPVRRTAPSPVSLRSSTPETSPGACLGPRRRPSPQARER